MAHPEFAATPSQHTVHRELEGAPLGPDSLLWKYFDNRMAFQASAGIKQLMMYGIDAGIAQHSNFFDEIVERTMRSMVKIGDTVYDKDEGERIGRGIRDMHFGVKGVDTTGHRYHALDPRLFSDTHLTFVDSVYDVADRFDNHDLTYAEREQLYAETVTWYHQYGVSDRYLPANYAEYKQRSDELAESYVLTETAKAALAYAVKGKLPRPNIVPQPVWSALGMPMRPGANVMGAVIVSGLPEQVRDKYSEEIPYTAVDRAQVQLLEMAVKNGWGSLPAMVRYPDAAYQAFRREGQFDGPVDRAYLFGKVIGSAVLKTAGSVVERVPFARKLVTVKTN